MRTIVVTGADGFIGLHARMFLREEEKKGSVRAAPLTREDFADDAKLHAALMGADAVIHLAGINKGTDEELDEGNIALARRLVSACVAVKAAPHIVFASSIHEASDTPYGRGKKGAGEVLAAFAREHASLTTTLVLPHVFGEFARPDYNSAVATFVRDLVEGRASEVRPEGKVTLVYVREVIARMMSAIEEGTEGRIEVAGEPWKIPELYALLSSMNEAYRAGVEPAVASRTELALFNTLHSALFSKVFPMKLSPHTDERGSFYEVVRSFRNDQVSFSTTAPGKERGNHYHTRKMERFCVIGGEGEIRVRRLLDDTVMTFKVSGNEPVVIDMPTYHTHSLVNTGAGDLLTLFWISEQYNPADPDSYPEVV